ncbi:MAG: amidase family protein, partial [Flavicella sp.]|nr:amidase family protein [Flavicella sp.]
MESQIKKIHKQLLSKEISCTALVQEKLTDLAKNTHNTVNSLLDVMALDLAAKVDAKIARGETIGLLEGIPFGIKDVYMLQGTVTTA